jgi:hypothetical protein
MEWDFGTLPMIERSMTNFCTIKHSSFNKNPKCNIYMAPLKSML